MGPEERPEERPEDGPAEADPPPVPVSVASDVAAPWVSAGPPAPRRRRWPALVLVVLLVVGAAAAGVVAGLAGADRIAVPDALRDPAALARERDAALIELLEDVIRTEGVMLTFNDVVAERLEGALDEAEALQVVALAAASGVGGLEALRPRIVVQLEEGPVGDVREAYLPHLDSWIDYLAALADEPALLFTREEQQPYILRINATADVFREALEDLIAADPPAVAAELADRILDDGFRSEGPEPTV